MRLVALWWLALFIPLLGRADSLRLRVQLPSGATVFAEKFPGSQVVSVQVIASARGSEDLPSRPGTRHLLEHLAALGKNRLVDSSLEGEGLFLTATTYRDSMRFRVDCRRSQVPLAIKALSDVIGGLRATPDEITREIRLMREELALQSEARIRQRGAVEIATGQANFDPIGRPELLGATTFKELSNLARTHFCAANLVVAVGGDLEVDEGIQWAKTLAAAAPASPAAELAWKPTPEIHPTKIQRDDHWVFVMPYENWRDPQSASLITAGFALAALTQGDITFTPSARSGIIVLDIPNDERFRALWDLDNTTIWSVGHQSVRRWLDTQSSTPGESIALRASLLVQQPDATPEAFLELCGYRSSEFSRAMAAWRKLCQPS